MHPRLCISLTHTTPLLPSFITAADIGVTVTVDARETIITMVTIVTAVTTVIVAMIMAIDNHQA